MPPGVNFSSDKGFGVAFQNRPRTRQTNSHQDGLAWCAVCTWASKCEFLSSYANGVGLDSPSTEHFASSGALRLRVDALDAYPSNYGRLTSYLSLTRARAKAKAETGGGFPACWGSLRDGSTILRLGSDGVVMTDKGWTLLGRVEGGHLLKAQRADRGGNVPGIDAFEMPALAQRATWLRVAAGAEVPAGIGTLSLCSMLRHRASNPFTGLLLPGRPHSPDRIAPGFPGFAVRLLQ